MNLTFEPAKDLDESEREGLLNKIKKAGKARKKRKSCEQRGQKLKTVSSVIITLDMLPELERRLREARFKITGAIVGSDGTGEIELTRYREKIVRYATQNGHIVRDPPLDVTYHDGKINENPEPTLCELRVDDERPVDRGRCWKCAIRVPDGVTFEQIAAYGSRGWLHELQQTRHAFLLDGSPRSKSTVKTAQDAMSRSLRLVTLDTPASSLAVSSLRYYREPKSAAIRVASTPAAELHRLGLIETFGQDETTKLDMYQLTTEGLDLFQKWVDLES